MKKIIGILGVAVIAATMFFNTNNLCSSSPDLSLVNLIKMNTANAELDGQDGIFGIDTSVKCTAEKVTGRIWNSYKGRWEDTIELVDGHRIDCIGFGGWCITGTDCEADS